MNIIKFFKNLLSGASSISIYPSAPDIEFGDFETDKKALASDWKAVGNDFKTILN